MDDFLKYLIWLIIIISFLSSFFKKKKPLPPADENDDRDTFPVKEQSLNTVEKGEYDILKEIESMFKADTSQPTRIEKTQGWQGTKPTESEHVSYERTRTPDEYTSYEKGRSPSETYKTGSSRSAGETKLTSSEHVPEDWVKKREAKRKIAQVDLSVAKQAAAFEKFLKNRDSETVNMAAIINKKLKQPLSIKEYLIIGEILKRPRSLRAR